MKAALAAIVGFFAISAGMPAAAAQALPGDFVFLRDVDSTILQDIRYAGSNNFVGRPLKGYEAGECIVTRRVAAALLRVQRDLVSQGLSLKMLDCYRPQRAVDDICVGAGRA
jgi:D-alanyl-D-alanine dipeptidase